KFKLILAAFAANLGVCSISRAEITGIVLGLEKAWEMGVRDIVVQSDSLCAVRLLSSDDSLDHQHATIVSKYKKLLDRDWRVELKHVYRESNHLADALASKGHSLSIGTHMVERSDRVICYWARFDEVGGTEMRRIIP
ncbi:Putative ribonuclease H protein At1g65750, partial [Linum perenne]